MDPGSFPRRMRLQRHRAQVYKGATYWKYVVVLPAREVEKLGWREGQALEARAEAKRLVICKKDQGHG